MKGLAPLFLGIFGTFAFSWVGLTVIPNWQIGHLNPQSDEEGTDIYPMPQSGMVMRGARVYAANGCIYCHSEQVRADYAGADIERKWGDRRSAPRDYIFERPVFLGKMCMGQDLANIGARAPKEEESPSPTGGASPAPQGAAVPPGAVASAKAGSPAPSAAASPLPASSPAAAAATPPGAIASKPPTSPWSRPVLHLQSLLQQQLPRAQVQLQLRHRLRQDHRGPSKRRDCRQCIPLPGITCIFIRRAVSILTQICRPIGFSTRLAESVTRVHQTLCNLPVPRPRQRVGEIVPTYNAKCLVAYMMALNQSHPLKDVRSAGASAAASPAASPSPAPAGQPAK